MKGDSLYLKNEGFCIEELGEGVPGVYPHGSSNREFPVGVFCIGE